MTRVRNTLLLGIVVCLAVLPARARILEVPSEFETIQSALDSSAEWDTVRIAPGDYAEFLVSPLHSVVIIGEQMPDSVGAQPTRLDPSLLPGSDTLAILIARSDTCLVKNLMFVNGPEMRTGEWPIRSGGIANNTLLLRIVNCVFDSVRSAVQGGQKVEVSHSRFTGSFAYCIMPDPTARVLAVGTEFDGSGFWLVSASSGSRFDGCRFTSWGGGTDLLHLYGSGIVVHDCRFGPRTGAFPAVRLFSTGNCEISNCEFAGIRDCSSIIECAMDCPGPDGDPFIIRGNTFENFHPNLYPLAASRAISMVCQDFQAGYWGIIEGNTIRNGSCTEGGGISCPGISGGPAQYIGNRLSDLSPPTLPDMRIDSWGLTDSVVLRENWFEPPGIGLIQVGAPTDARWNWWGDSTGPYNGSLNPQGQGAEIGSGIEFIPWLTDTSMSSSEIEIILHPSSFVLTAFPNPFNSKTQIEIRVSKRGDYALVLYDITGREVRELMREFVEREATVSLDARNLPSGTYLAKLENALTHETLTAEKLILLK